MPLQKNSKTQSKGVGDTIAKITKATGVDKLVHAIVGDDCGCEQRRQTLNRLFPYATPMDAEARATYEATFNGWEQWPEFNLEKQRVLVTMLTTHTGRRYKLTRCGSCVRQNMKQLETIYNNSCEQ